MCCTRRLQLKFFTEDRLFVLEKASTARIMIEEIIFVLYKGVYKSNSDEIEKNELLLSVLKSFMPMMLLNGSRIKRRSFLLRRVAQ